MVSGGSISSVPISAAPHTGGVAVVMLSGNLTEPVGQLAGAVTITNRVATPGCAVDFPTGTGTGG